MKFTGPLLITLTIASFTSPYAEAKTRHHHHHHHAASHTQAVSNHTVYGVDNLSSEISQILEKSDPHANIGIQIKSMKNGDMFFSRNEQHLFTPASTLKILTAEAAFILLGSDYKFKTEVVTDAASTANGVIDGNVYLIHSGDPSLTYYDMTDLMVTLKSMPIQTINGNIYVDNTAYDQHNFGPGWEWNDTRYCYAAPINASIINHNCISFGISPAKSEGHYANILQNPRFYYAGFNNAVMTKSSHTRSCRISLSTNVNNIISIDGCMPRGHYSRGASVIIPNVLKYNEAMLQSLLQRFNIQVNGTIDAKAAPANLTSLASHESKPLHALINEMLKKSDNIIAASLFKKIGQTYSKEPGSWSNGAAAVKAILAEKAGVSTSSMNLSDGSGLSRDNRVSPSQMMQVLDYAYHNEATNYEFISALPIAGVDGTLKNRLFNVRAKVRAKTGTMSKDGVVSLAGYAMSKDKEPIAFVIIVNGRHGNAWEYKETEDKIVTALANFSR